MTAMLTDSSAVRIQRAVRAHMARSHAGCLRRPDAYTDVTAHQLARAVAAAVAGCGIDGGRGQNGVAADAPVPDDKCTKRQQMWAAPSPLHLTPPPGGRAFLGGSTSGASPGAEVIDSRAGLGGNRPTPTLTPYRLSRSPPSLIHGSFMSPVRKTPPGWKKGIEDQVSLINEKLIDSARKGARSRSRSPPPASAEEVMPVLFDFLKKSCLVFFLVMLTLMGRTVINTV